MVTYGFYNSKNGDRKYDAIQMSSIFDGIIRDGILQHYGTAMVVKESEGMMVNVGIGRAWFNHTWTLNDALLPLTVPISEVLLNRIDAVVLEVDSREAVRANSIKIVKGTPASSPKNPTLVKTNDRWQYPLAYIRVNAGVTSIRQANITNCVGTSACPFVTAPLEKMSIDALVAQWGDQWKAFYGAQTSDMEATNAFWKNQWRTWFQAQTTEIQEAYLNWEHQWEEFFNNQTTEMQEANTNWKTLWENWFYEYVNANTKEFTDWKNSIDKDFRDWWEAVKDLIDAKDVSAFADELVALKERTGKLEEFQNELTNTHSIHDSLDDSSDKAILDGNNEPIEGRRVTFVVEKGSDVGNELEDVKRRLLAIEQAFDGLANEFTVYQILTDGGTWLYVDNPDTARTEQLLDDKGDVIRGKTIFVTK
ncbi:hypothetical protein [Bacteroides caecimuris]|uniref:hypothetical protein n=1 Tax=Bacteroides caecimuris TaxID=1796613 RepID=UPI0026EFD5DE|nr:hypothetical protein [Bacteroides caecimuris]